MSNLFCLTRSSLPPLPPQPHSRRPYRVPNSERPRPESKMLLRYSSRIRELLSCQIKSRNPPPAPLSFFSTTSRRKKGKGGSESDSDDSNGLGLFVSGGDLNRAPKLFVVQPRLRPEPVLQSKLEEALNLANSLEQPRDGFYEEEFETKGSPPHLVVQNPAIRSVRAHAGLFSVSNKSFTFQLSFVTNTHSTRYIYITIVIYYDCNCGLWIYMAKVDNVCV